MIQAGELELTKCFVSLYRHLQLYLVEEKEVSQSFIEPNDEGYCGF